MFRMLPAPRHLGGYVAQGYLSSLPRLEFGSVSVVSGIRVAQSYQQGEGLPHSRHRKYEPRIHVYHDCSRA
jgi:hypothetical protein